MSFLSGKKVKLRPLEKEDVDLLYVIENNPAVWEVSHTLTPYSKTVLQDYIASSSADIYTSKQLRLVITTKEGVPVGLIDLFDFDAYHSRVGIGILVVEKERSKGYANESLELLIDYVQSHLGLKQVYCNVTADNFASIKLFENCKFVKCGEKKHWIKAKDRWKDEWMYQLLF